MHGIALSEKDLAKGTVETRFWDPADPFRAESRLSVSQLSQPVSGLIFPSFAELQAASVNLNRRRTRDLLLLRLLSGHVELS